MHLSLWKFENKVVNRSTTGMRWLKPIRDLSRFKFTKNKNCPNSRRGDLIISIGISEVLFSTPSLESSEKLHSEGHIYINMMETGEFQMKNKHIFHMRPFLALKVHFVVFYCISKMSLSLRFDVCQNLNNFRTHKVKDYSAIWCQNWVNFFLLALRETWPTRYCLSKH